MIENVSHVPSFYFRKIKFKLIKMKKQWHKFIESTFYFYIQC